MCKYFLVFICLLVMNCSTIQKRKKIIVDKQAILLSKEEVKRHGEIVDLNNIVKSGISPWEAFELLGEPNELHVSGKNGKVFVEYIYETHCYPFEKQYTIIFIEEVSDRIEISEKDCREEKYGEYKRYRGAAW